MTHPIRKTPQVKAWAVWTDVSNCICMRGYCEPFELYGRRRDARHRIKTLGLSKMRAIPVLITPIRPKRGGSK